MFKKESAAGAVLCFALLAGCATGQVEVVKDDFKNTSMVKMELNHTTFMSGIAKAVYTREFSASNKGPVIINYAFNTTVNSANLESKCILKADDTTYDMVFGAITGEVQTEIHQNAMAGQQAKPAVNNSGFVDYSKPAGGEISTTSRKIFRSKLALSEAAEKGILSAKKIALRIYYGTEAVTFTAEGSDLQCIKDFIQSTPTNIVKTASVSSASKGKPVN
jgi:hypothetical protein